MNGDFDIFHNNLVGRVRGSEDFRGYSAKNPCVAIGPDGTVYAMYEDGGKTYLVTGLLTRSYSQATGIDRK